MRNKTATDAARAYLSAACEGDAKGMRHAQQRSYRGAATGLRQHLVGFTVEREESVAESEVVADVFVRCKVAGFEDREPELFRLRCVCEDDEGHPTPDGSWGANPASLRKVEPEPAA